MPNVYLPDEHTLLVYLLILIFFSSLRRRLDLFSCCVCMIFYTFYLFIIIIFFGIVLDFFYCFCFCLGFVVNFDLTGFTKSIYFRTRFVCTNWASIQSLQCDRFVHLQINLDQRVYV